MAALPNGSGTARLSVWCELGRCRSSLAVAGYGDVRIYPYWDWEIPTPEQMREETRVATPHHATAGETVARHDMTCPRWIPVLARTTFALYLGWSSIAVFANTAAALISSGVSASVTWWQFVVLVAAAVFAWGWRRCCAAIRHPWRTRYGHWCRSRSALQGGASTALAATAGMA